MRCRVVGLSLLLGFGWSALAHPDAPSTGRHWLAGEHHIHSRNSVAYDAKKSPPEPLFRGGEPYPIAMNALMARHNGLSWMVSTDHGGPNHAQINRDRAYPELVHSREVVPDVIQFYGMELNVPAAEHASVIIPHSHHEDTMLFDIESRYDREEVWPKDPSRQTEEKMIEALKFMRELNPRPLVLANHPSRTAKDLGQYGAVQPHEIRNWNDAAPEVAVGMEGAPGHQANTLARDGTIKPDKYRASYNNFPTLGGYDQMTARLGGAWDSLLGEGRRWWVTANSDSHSNWREGGGDFWPGEFTKTYVLAEKSYADILDGLRHGRVFVTTGDLVSELDVTVSAKGAAADIGGALRVTGPTDLTVTIRLRDPAGANHGGRKPEVARVDLIVGAITGPVKDRAQDTNPTTKVVQRFTPADWQREGETIRITYALKNVTESCYVRVRGTNTADLEPVPDAKGEDPWSDLWFYSNPVFVEFAGS